MLYLVPTPIGNLKDITLRAIEVLQEVDLILAEDTRVSGKLLKHYDIDRAMRAFHQHNEHRNVEGIINLLQSGQKIALISDAGSPGISDPGFLLVRACREKDVEICALPGATAFVPALVVSGFPTDRFIYEGFLPQKKGRASRIAAIAQESKTVVLYESPHRVEKLVKALSEVLDSQRRIALVREISKLHEEHQIGSCQELLAQLQERPPKGEYVVVIEGGTKKKAS